jgi:hypothetical protein
MMSDMQPAPVGSHRAHHDVIPNLLIHAIV